MATKMNQDKGGLGGEILKPKRTKKSIYDMRTPSSPTARTDEDGYKLIISLPLETPGANNFKGRRGSFLTRKLRQLSKELLFAALQGQYAGRINKPQGRRKVTFEQYRGRRLDEGDNDRIVLKAVRDAIVDIGLLKDDSPKYADFAYIQYAGIQQAERRVIITIESVDENGAGATTGATATASFPSGARPSFKRKGNNA